MLEKWIGGQCAWSPVRKREGVEKERKEKEVEKETGTTLGLVGGGEAFGFNCMHHGSY